jgi:hypothetical protein
MWIIGLVEGHNAPPHRKRKMTLLEQLTAAFAEADAESIANIPAEVKESREQFRALQAELREMFPRDQDYEKRRSVLYRQVSKQTIKDVTEHGFDGHVERVIKRTKRTHESRNQRIAQKFEKAGISEIDSDLVVLYGKDFCGKWIIGGHLVKLDVIWAGGYNIQCLHCRVLCTITKIKDAA